MVQFFDAVFAELPKLQEFWRSAVVITVAALAFGWVVGRFMYGQRIENLKGDLTSADRRIAEYKEKLDGKSPDEAHAQIEALRNEIAALASYGLSAEGMQRLKDALVGTSGIINIYKTSDASDADRLYRQTISAFRSIGWTVNSHSILGLRDRPDSGVTLIHWDATDQGLVAAVRHALDLGGLNPSELTNPTGWGSETNLTIVFSSRDPDWVPPGRWK